LSDPLCIGIDEHIDAQQVMFPMGADMGIEHFPGKAGLGRENNNKQEDSDLLRKPDSVI